MRLGIGRGRYRVEPGLYSLGQPGTASPVFARANYKMSFDALRSSLRGMDAWILALDTKGVNVWCAAGKGSFGTAELVRSIEASGLREAVDHREIVVPQLGAPGVAAHEVRGATGFSVRYGPVRARDIPAWLANGKRKTEAMKRVRFGLRDRLALAPLELIQSWPLLAGATALALAPELFGAGEKAPSLGYRLLSMPGAVAAGALLVPALLPLRPFKAFALKGAALGAAWSFAAAALTGTPAPHALGLGLAGTAAAAFVAMNFTGASTFTCPRGAEAEVRRGLPWMLGSAAAGVAGFAISLFA